MPKKADLNQDQEQTLRGLVLHLVKEGALSKEQAIDAVENSSAEGIPCVLYLVKNEILSSTTILKIASKEFGVPVIDLNAFNTELVPRDLFNEKIVRKHHAFPLYLSPNNQLFIAVSDPTNLAALYEFKFSTGLYTHPILVEEPKLTQLIDRAIGTLEASALDRASADILEEIELVDETKKLINEIGERDSEDDAPIIRFINKLLLDAINKGASDIHFEPFENDFRIRFRQDGILYETTTLTSNLKSRIASRIKVMSKLNSTEHRLPQDGHFKWQFSKTHIIDFRVSICPTIHGEKVVIRVLDPGHSLFSVNDLGLSEAQHEIIVKTIQQSQGMVLVTGPTGSGKTITLYALLSAINTIDKNISTAEDPVEIELKGINQVSVNPKAGLDFSTILRSFLRQDPDVIMVGEMRDFETADIGIKAAQTGHLVFATLHTNNAPATLSRLVNIGIPSYNVGSSVHLIIAQRLARRLCKDCKKEITPPKKAFLDAGFKEEEFGKFKIYGPTGCSKCLKGYKGRVGIFELLPISKTLATIITNGGTEMEITDQAVKEGMIPLHQAGLNKIKEGVTSIEEIDRVITTIGD